MDWKDLAGIVGKAAPALGTLLGGPAGAAVGGLIASALGTANAPEDVAAAVKDPEALVKLRQIEADKATKLQELITEQAKAIIADTQNARQREIELAKISQAPWFVPSVTTALALIVVVGGGWMFFNIDNTDTRYALVATVTSVLGYYFGTTANSNRKTELLAQGASAKGGV